MRHIEVRRGVYRDSVQLMQISAAIGDDPGVERALVAMATGMNLDLLAEMGFEPPPSTGPNDMVVALVTASDSPDAPNRALSLLEAELAGSANLSHGSTGNPVTHRSVGSAVRGLGGDAAIVLVSTPGRNSFVEAMEALEAGASVMVFSDNVPLAQEVRLKREAAARGLLVMGPDCGTAVIGGVGLGFANVVRTGPVGLVAASGTGAQQVMSLLSAPVGISHCIGVGGRDLAGAVGGSSTHAAVDLLDADPATELIVVLGKPGATSVEQSVHAHLDRLATPSVFAQLGPGQPDLTAVVERLLARRGLAAPTWPVWAPSPGPAGPAGPADPADRADPEPAAAGGQIRGLFSGGTLCVEAMAIAVDALGVPVRSNVPLRPEWSVSERKDGHRMLDLGDDAYTVARPHPMIDFGPRLALLAAEAADPACRVLLLDVVLGHGAHPDPAAELAPAIHAALARAAPLSVVVSLVGTVEDPQGLHRQAQVLREAGAWVYASNAAAARHAVSLVGGTS